MGEGSLVPIGVPLPYPLATPPTGFLKCNGLSFSTATYPKLALAYPSGVLPDLRGEFLRGWDDGRGVDAGRALLSLKLDTLQGHKHTIIDSENPNYTGANGRVGDLSFGGIQYVGNAGPNSSFQASTMITNGINGTPRVDSETSPRNVAFNYIVRAA
ncbi:phage tail protein [Yersinia intermedia]|nr:phage tail protein [Yersinia intermedia]